MLILFRKLVAVVTAIALGLATTAPTFAATTAAIAADPAACRVDDEEAFRAEVDRLTLAALEVGLEDVDYHGLVAEVWHNQAIDSVLDRRIDDAIAQIKEETSWTTIVKSLASQEAARKLAEAVAVATKSKATSWSAEELVRSHGGYGEALLNDLSVTSAKARRVLGWVPRHTSFVAEAPELWRDWQAARVTPVR